MLMGFSGIQTGKILNTLLEKVINDEIENNKTALKEYTDAFLQN